MDSRELRTTDESGPAAARDARSLVAVALAVLAVVVAIDAARGDLLPIELLYLPCVIALGWFGSTWPAVGVALLAAVAPALLHAAGVAGAREPALEALALRAVAFVLVVVAAARARRQWTGLLDRSHEDSLTRLLNHGAFEDALAHELARQRRERSDLSVVSLDVDGFKHLNDTLGHKRGDRVLVGVARELREHVRAADVVARVGGDEFAVLLPGGGSTAAAVVREHLRAVLTTWAARERLEIGFSFGVATSEAHAPLDAVELLARADQDMYREKSRHHAETGVHERATWPAPH
jgi:diguanylate cyclase (GGDEF)-like protein